MKTNVFAIFIILVSFSIFHAKAQSSDVETKTMHMFDQYAYKTAVDMYAVADTLPYSKDADVLIKNISGKIDQGLSIENETIWTNLQKLEPYRMHHKVQAAVKTWVDKSVRKISTQSTSKQVTLSVLQSASQAYKSGHFEHAVQEYKNILSGAPKHSDVRSNMGLALMHLNKDLCAQIELEIVAKLYDTHLPAQINLVVVYERMKLSKNAENLVTKLSSLANSSNLDVPMVRFNAAWYRFQSGDYIFANTLLNSPQALKDTTMEKYNMLRKVNRMQLQ